MFQYTITHKFLISRVVSESDANEEVMVLIPSTSWNKTGTGSIQPRADNLVTT